MRVVPPVNGCVRLCLQLSLLLLCLNAFALCCFSLWLLWDPAQHFLLQLVHFSEQPPLLLFSAQLMLATSGAVLLGAAVGCVATAKMERCLLSGFIALLLFALLAKGGTVLLALLYQAKFPTTASMTAHLANITQNHYSRDKWVQPVMDHVQYYHQCCGGRDARDYLGSFWYLTNTERGTRSFVPWSCCRQSQQGRAWALLPIDPLCIQYSYGTRAFNDSVHTKGCGEPTKRHLDMAISLLVLLLLLTSTVDLVCLCMAVNCLRQVWTFYSAIAELEF